MMELDSDGDKEADSDDDEYTLDESDDDFDNASAEDGSENEYTPYPTPRRSRRRWSSWFYRQEFAPAIWIKEKHWAFRSAEN